MNHSTQQHQKPAQASSKAMVHSEKPSKAQQQALKRFPAYPVAVCRTLHRLTTKLHVFQSRVEFVVLAFKHSLVSDITSYDLWDRGYEGLGERQFDACFEMGDSEDVIAELIRTARKEGFIDNIRTWCGNESFDRWCSYADRQGELF